LVVEKRTLLGQFLVDERKKRGWNQSRLCVEAEIGMSTVVRLETGVTDLRQTRIGTLQSLARALDTTTIHLVELLERSEEE
jgi:transcriptional regulator with XRE-family HTH domain